VLAHPNGDTSLVDERDNGMPYTAVPKKRWAGGGDAHDAAVLDPHKTERAASLVPAHNRLSELSVFACTCTRIQVTGVQSNAALCLAGCSHPYDPRSWVYHRHNLAPVQQFLHGWKRAMVIRAGEQNACRSDASDWHECSRCIRLRASDAALNHALKQQGVAAKRTTGIPVPTDRRQKLVGDLQACTSARRTLTTQPSPTRRCYRCRPCMRRSVGHHSATNAIGLKTVTFSSTARMGQATGGHLDVI